ncbi:MAG TPA: hypothetical protein ENI64_04600 [Gammaproteobacteria bacterium]|nr:hypothetical protein [Gammaproteobacteria bacterium]
MTRQIKRHSTLQCLTVAAMAMILTACVVKPIPHQSIQQSALREIAQSYRMTVRQAYESTNKTWVSGWAGNMAVNFQDNNTYGLCYHWKKIVYAGVVETVERVGWRMTGITVNEATTHEHHAVLVYDPALFRHKDLPSPAKQHLAYVLDPWRTGKAEIYTLDKWLERAGQITVEPRLVAVVTDLQP